MSCVVGLSDTVESDDVGEDQVRPFPSQQGASVAFGDFVVVLRATTPSSASQPGKHDITLLGRGGQSRSIVVFDFNHWPRDSVPDSTANVVDLVVAAESAQRSAIGPMVVHSAGAGGRTGCVIAVIEQMRMYSRMYSVHPFESVVALRQARADTVRTSQQYIFVHKAIVMVIMRNTGM